MSEAIKCAMCGSVRFTNEPCVYCYGSKQPGTKKCSDCFSFRDGKCHRIEDDVKPWWTGCILHCVKVTTTGN